MKIFALSDIRWNAIRLEQLIERIRGLRPDVVLLAGDLVNDKFGSRDGRTFGAEEYWDEVAGLLAFLSGSRIQTFFVRGNWDYSAKADRILRNATRRLRYVKDLSEQAANYRGVRFLGVSYAFANDLGKLKSLVRSSRQPVDIVLAHAEFKRRIWLFHLDAQLVITGHFDSQLSRVQNKVFISMDRFPAQYAVIDYGAARFTVRYVNQDAGIDVRRKATFAGGRLHWRARPITSLRRDSELYAARVEQLLAAGSRLEHEPADRQDIVDSLLANGVPRKHVEDYLGISLPAKERTH
jgi:predicted phosphodiesterase